MKLVQLKFVQPKKTVMKLITTNLFRKAKLSYLVSTFLILLISLNATAHQVDAYNASCNAGPQYVVTATVSSVNTSSNYRWQWKSSTGVWNCFVNGANTINGNSYNVSGAVFNLTTTPGPLVFTNPTNGLQGLEIRMVISDGAGVNPCTLPAGNTWTNAAGVANHFINVNGTGCATQLGCACTNSAANLLTNGSFENGTTNWNWSAGSITTGTGYVVCGIANGFLNAAATGSTLGWQQVNATAGTTYNASAYLGTHAPGLTCAPKFLLYFYNAAGTLLTSNVVNVTTNVDVSPYLPTLYSISAVAPAGTSFLRIGASIDCNTMKMDAFCLTSSVTCTGKVTSLYFNELAGGADLPITNGSTFSIAQLGSLYNLEAGTSGTIGSVKYTITGPTPTSNIENAAPYNSPATSGGPWTGAAGTYSVNLKTYNAADGTGTQCHDTTITFNLVNNTAAIGDYVWNDGNGNGLQDATESGLSGVQVQLLNSAGTVIATTTSNAVGYYQFTGLAAGTYTVKFLAVAGFGVSPANVGTNDAIDSDVDGTGSVTVVLAAGQSNQTIDAGFCPTTLCIGNLVWNDVNNNGIKDATEVGISGATVNIYQDANNDNIADGAAFATTTTSTTGTYSFCNLVPGNYIVGVVTPAGFVKSTTNAGDPDNNIDNDNNGINIVGTEVRGLSLTLAGGTEPDGTGSTTSDINNTYDFGFTTTSILKLGNFVFWDLNNNGLFDGTDFAAANQTLRLYVDANNDNVPDGAAIATTTTNATGNYLFSGLAPNNYIVEFVVPAGDLCSTTNGGDPDNNIDNDNNGITTTGITRSLAVTLAAGTEPTTDGDDANGNLTVDFGIFKAAALGDFVWVDTNQNGLQDSGEPGLAGVTVTLKNAAGTVIGTTTTSATGAYSFTNLPIGSYTVTFTTPAGYAASPSNVGANDAIDSDPVAGVVSVTLANQETNNTIDAGFYPILMSLGDRVFADANNNGVRDAAEVGIAGLTVNLYLDANNDNIADGAAIATTTTNATGNYLFSNLNPGNYIVGVTPAAGFISSTNAAIDPDNNVDLDDNGTNLVGSEWRGLAITLAPGTEFDGTNSNTNTNITYDFGFFQPATIGDFVFNDINANGIQDAGELGIAGVTVTLTFPDLTTATTTTNASGLYSFTNLGAGTYNVAFTTPAGFTPTGSNVGANDAIDSDPISGVVTGIVLTAGQVNNTIDAGFYQANLNLGNIVWFDQNNDGVRQGTEIGIVGATVNLYADANNDNVADGAAIATTTTITGGGYSFANLAPGNYIVGVIIPAGYAVVTTNGGDPDNDTDNDNNGTNTSVAGEVRSSAVTLTTGGEPLLGVDGDGANGNLTVDFGFKGTASIGDFVFNDANGNGIQDGGELGIPNATVTLTFPNGATVTTTTNVSGIYSFTNLAPGTYSVAFTTPAGFIPTGSNVGANDAVDSDPVSGVVTGIVLTAGQVNNTIDAGFYTLASLGDKVWRDDNKNGVQDAGEPGVSGITVSLFDNTGKQVGSVVTDAYGNYLFSNLVPGDYTVGITLPTNYTFTSSTGTSETDATNSDVNPTSGNTTIVNLSSGENQVNVDAGIIFSTQTPKANIGDRVWLDTNKDGIQNAGEPGVSGVTVTLFDNLGNVVATAITDANGNYLFTDVTPGTGYTIGFTAPAGTVFSPKDQTADSNDSDADPVTGRTAPFTVVAGVTDLSFDAGLSPQTSTKASLGDKVWNDLNKDGKQDANEPGLAGVTVNLYDAAGTTLLATTKTDAFGNYIFTNLNAGSYVVEFVKPVGYTSSPKDAGTDDAKDSDADITTGKTAAVTLQAGDKITTVDAGMYVTTAPGLLQLGDKVFNDENRDGVQAATEDGIAGVTVTLYQNGLDGLPGTADDVKLKSTSTDVNGNYIFTDLAASTGASTNYNVQFSNLPSGYSFTTQDQTTSGGNDTNDSDPNPATGRTNSINLIANNLTVDAGLVQGIPAGKGSIGDRVWYDLPAGTTGVQDANETGVSGVTVKLYKDANNDGSISGAELTAVATTTTNALGNYMFGGLDAGTYQVGFSNLPAGFTLTTKDAGTDDAKDSDGNPLNTSIAGNTATAGTSYTGLVNLALGEDNLTVDLGIVPPANTNTLGGDVWADKNNDGNQTAGEPAIKGVMVTLYNAAGQPIATTVTDENGKYLFVGLPDGTYSVGFSSLPAGYNFTNQSAINDATGSDANVTTGRTGTVTLGAANRNDTSLDAGLVTTRAALGNYVWFDANSNGAQDATEKGISGVTVTLTRPGFGLDGIAGNADDALAVASAITDATGNYFFGNLAAGSYVVGFSTIPNNLVFTQQNTPGDNQNDTNSDANPATGLSSTIVLSAGETDLTIDAGVKPILPGAVGDFVWNDLNGNGIQDAGEPGIAGVLVTLYDAANNPVGSAITDGNGAYLITNVPAGTGYYAIFSNLPLGASFTTQDQTAGGGTDSNDSDANPTTGRTGSITITAGEINTTVDAGLLIATLNLGNVVWYDQNNDGIKQTTETGIVGATVKLYTDANNDNIADGAAVATTTTIAGGVYGFANLTPGNYIVGVTIPTGYAVVTTNGGDPDNDVDNDNNGTNTSVAGEVRSSAVTLTAGSEPLLAVDGDGANGNLTVDFGFKGTASIGDFVFNDTNGNGIQDGGELGIPNATVTLTFPNGSTATTTTNASGIYSFTDLAPGTYSVAFTTPIGYANASPANIGANDAVDSDPVSGVVSGIVLTPGQVNNTVDAGFYNCVPITSGINGPLTICAAESALFTATGAGSGSVYTWTFMSGTPATGTGTSVTSSWSTPGEYDITLTVTKNGCSVSYTRSIVITQSVFAGAGPDADICSGSSTTLNGTGPAGSNYSWTVIAGDPTSIDNGANQASVLVSPLVTTTYQLTVTQNGCTRTDQVTVFINVNKNPVADAGLNKTTLINAPVVIGGSPTGTPPLATPGAALGYIWSPSAGLNSNTISNPSATLTVPGVYNYQVIVYSILTGCSDTAVVSVTAVQPVNVGNYVWYDKNNNGIKDAGETGVNTTVNLYKDDNNDNVADGAAIATTSTVNGVYNFGNLYPGNYIVGAIIPAGYVVVTTNGGDPDNDIDNDNNGTNTSVAGEVRSSTVTLSAGGEPLIGVDGDNNNGNLTVDIALTGSAQLGNFVWEDVNRNGIQDPTEAGIANAIVTLTYPDGGTAVRVTNGAGAYQFDKLMPGTYSVAFTTPNGYIPTTSNVTGGAATDANDSDPVSGIVSNITLSAGQNNSTIDAGYYRPINIYGNVWFDANALTDNEVNKTSLSPIPNALNVYLVDDATGIIVQAEGIETNGTYAFLNVSINKTYRVVITSIVDTVGVPAPRAVLPSGWRNTGENLGAGPNSGDDGVINGVLFIDTETSDIFNANFGIRIKNGEVVVG